MLWWGLPPRPQNLQELFSFEQLLGRPPRTMTSREMHWAYCQVARLTTWRQPLMRKGWQDMFPEENKSFDVIIFPGGHYCLVGHLLLIRIVVFVASVKILMVEHERWICIVFVLLYMYVFLGGLVNGWFASLFSKETVGSFGSYPFLVANIVFWDWQKSMAGTNSFSCSSMAAVRRSRSLPCISAKCMDATRCYIPYPWWIAAKTACRPLGDRWGISPRCARFRKNMLWTHVIRFTKGGQDTFLLIKPL